MSEGEPVEPEKVAETPAQPEGEPKEVVEKKEEEKKEETPAAAEAPADPEKKPEAQPMAEQEEAKPEGTVKVGVDSLPSESPAPMSEMDDGKDLGVKDYLEKYVVPQVTNAFRECVRVRPENPLEYIGQFLIDNSKEADTLSNKTE